MELFFKVDLILKNLVSGVLKIHVEYFKVIEKNSSNNWQYPLQKEMSRICHILTRSGTLHKCLHAVLSSLFSF